MTNAAPLWLAVIVALVGSGGMAKVAWDWWFGRKARRQQSVQVAADTNEANANAGQAKAQTEATYEALERHCMERLDEANGRITELEGKLSTIVIDLGAEYEHKLQAALITMAQVRSQESQASAQRDRERDAEYAAKLAEQSIHMERDYQDRLAQHIRSVSDGLHRLGEQVSQEALQRSGPPK